MKLKVHPSPIDGGAGFEPRLSVHKAYATTPLVSVYSFSIKQPENRRFKESSFTRIHCFLVAPDLLQ